MIDSDDYLLTWFFTTGEMRTLGIGGNAGRLLPDPVWVGEASFPDPDLGERRWGVWKPKNRGGPLPPQLRSQHIISNF